MKQFILSICIPTFNRDKYLNKLLKSLELIERQNLKYVQICISNNSSNDNTAYVFNTYSNKFNIKYRNQQKNIGAAANLNMYIY